MAVSSKIRLDKLLVEQGLAASRERAQALVLAGRVLVDEQRVDKPGAPVAPDAAIRMLGQDLRYVSRGGLKLEGALRAWGINVKGLHCADIGASTGGFTDCLLQHGAASVLAVDTGYGQIAHKLRVDPRVNLMERTNARTLAPGALASQVAASAAPEAQGAKVVDIASDLQAYADGLGDTEPDATMGPPVIRFFAMDVSFIGASLVLPPVLAALAPVAKRWHGEAVVLVKPQFEAGREHVGKGGIVRDPEAHALAVARVADTLRELGGRVLAVMDSPILGMEGNREFLLHARFEEQVVPE